MITTFLVLLLLGPETTGPAAHPYFPDLVLSDQNGQMRRFYSDVFKGKIVVFNTFFASCTGSCPLLNRTMAAMQEHLGERLGKEVVLVSITVDPVNDTPERLHAYAQRFGARPGWLFLTGEPDRIQNILGKLGQAVATPEQHMGLFIMGNDPTGLWKKVLGLGPDEEVLEILDSVLADRE